MKIFFSLLLATIDVFSNSRASNKERTKGVNLTASLRYLPKQPRLARFRGSKKIYNIKFISFA